MGAPESFIRARLDGGLALRPAQTRDGAAMWRMAQRCAPTRGLSPFFFMTLIQHFGRHCMIIERGGEIIGYLIASAPRDGGVIRLIELCLASPAEATATVFETLDELTKLPEYRSGAVVEPSASCDPAVKQALRQLVRAQESDQLSAVS